MLSRGHNQAHSVRTSLFSNLLVLQYQMLKINSTDVERHGMKAADARSTAVELQSLNEVVVPALTAGV